jgi:hypothetical protein
MIMYHGAWRGPFCGLDPNEVGHPKMDAGSREIVSYVLLRAKGGGASDEKHGFRYGGVIDKDEELRYCSLFGMSL